MAWVLSAGTACYRDDPAEALRRLGRYKRLAPVDAYSVFLESFYTHSYAAMEDWAAAAEVGTRLWRASPRFTANLKTLLAALVALDRRDEAAAVLRDLMAAEPSFTVALHARRAPMLRTRVFPTILDGLRRAGVPEG